MGYCWVRNVGCPTTCVLRSPEPASTTCWRFRAYTWSDCRRGVFRPRRVRMRQENNSLGNRMRRAALCPGYGAAAVGGQGLHDVCDYHLGSPGKHTGRWIEFARAGRLSHTDIQASGPVRRGLSTLFFRHRGILLFYRPIRAWLPGGGGSGMGQWVWTPLAVSVAAQVGTLPFVLAYFGFLSVVSVLANLVVVPLMAAAVALGLVGVVVFHVWSPIAALLNGANWIVLKGAIQAAAWFAEPAWAAVEVPRPGWTVVGLYLCAALLILPGTRSHRWGRRLVLVGLSLANLWVWSGIWQRPSGLRMLVLDVGQGDGIFLRFPNGRTMLVDGGLRAANIDMGNGY